MTGCLHNIILLLEFKRSTVTVILGLHIKLSIYANS